MARPQVGDLAPDFTLPSDSDTITLSSLKGKPVVLYFYPKDDTSGCTKEAIAFSQLKPEFDKIGARVIGLSPDSAEKHAKFRKKHELTVDLAADEDRTALEAYGVWVEKSMYGRKYMGRGTRDLPDRCGRTYCAHVGKSKSGRPCGSRP
jgi:peroxiredoxin Q/BCP